MRLGRERQKGVNLALHEQLDRFDLRVGHPIDVLGWVEPDMGSHHRHEQGPGRSHSPHAHALTLQVGDASDAFSAEQLIAADMDTREQRDRIAGVDR